MLDQLAMNKMDKPTNLTKEQKLLQQVAELKTSVQILEHDVCAIRKGDTIALAKVQLKINGPRYSFTFPEYVKFAHIVMRLDEVAGEGVQVKDQRLDLQDTRSVMVNKDLYVFQEGAPVSV